jgi:hypothetical protein
MTDDKVSNQPIVKIYGKTGLPQAHALRDFLYRNNRAPPPSNKALRPSA